jgi:hypothetical protein
MAVLGRLVVGDKNSEKFRKGGNYGNGNYSDHGIRRNDPFVGEMEVWILALLPKSKRLAENLDWRNNWKR